MHRPVSRPRSNRLGAAALGLALALLLAPAPADAQQRTNLLWLEPGRVDLATLIGLPPAMNSPEQKREFDEVLQITLNRTPEREKAAIHWIEAAPNTLAAALVKLSDFIRINKPERVWANGAVFDIGILEHAYRSKGLVIPWKYNQVRDSRTIRQEIPMLAERTATGTYVPVGEPAHHPITDCKVQINDLWIRGF
ncbi:MAG: hypothetical protein B7Z40_19340 [Bosea sp. 12-68-7]|nr:MAG: hypothetical protein B7Z40_19340 [Bosea sp. 12-68-7]